MVHRDGNGIKREFWACVRAWIEAFSIHTYGHGVYKEVDSIVA